MPSHLDLIKTDACTLVDELRRGRVTPHDLLDALEARIAEVDRKVNALPTLCFPRAREHADRLMKLPAGERGPLAGLPVPIKDLIAVKGVRTTQGSPIYADQVPARSDIVVERLEANGAIVYAKSNTPEFGAGANTFNEVFGATLNPWDLSRSAAGSSGGAAAAIASGTAWVAHGSDMGGSLRNPASFCGIVGLRPSVGRVALSCRSRQLRQDRPHPRGPGTDGPQCRRSRPAARRHDGRAPGRSAVVAATGPAVSRDDALKPAPAPGGLFGDARHHAGRPGSRAHHPGGGGAPRQGGHRRRGGASRSLAGA